MIQEIANELGLVDTRYFAREPDIPPGQHCLMLDGVRGSFGLSHVERLDLVTTPGSWAWSSGVLHHVTIAQDQVSLSRWDQPEPIRYSLSSVQRNLNRFYMHLAQVQATSTRTIATHAIDSFRRLRSLFPEHEQAGALSTFLLLLAGMIRGTEDALFEHANRLSSDFDLSQQAPEFLARLTPDFVHHFASGFRKPVTVGPCVETLPSLVVRHAGATVFQEAHFELIQRALPDIFGVPSSAEVFQRVDRGVHFTPPGLARALVEQALQAYGPLPADLIILDCACGSGSILHEALRTLHDLSYAGQITVIGFDESPYAVEMTKFMLAAIKQDWPDFNIATINIERRDSLSEEPWPNANIILMNPPFVSLRDLSKEQRQQISTILGPFARGRPDLSMAFVERALMALAPNGVLGTLLPAGVLAMTYAQAWRNHLLDQAQVSFLAVFGELGLFRLATVETGCVVFRKTPAHEHTLFKSLWVGEKKNATPEALRALRLVSRRKVATSESNEADAWTIDEAPVRSLRNSPTWRPRPRGLRRELRKIDAFVRTKVRSFFEVKQGAIPAPREAFLVGPAEWKDFPDQEKKWFRRVAENANIRAGQILPGSYIFYPRSRGLPFVHDERELETYIPQFYNRIVEFREQLKKRRGKQDRWWELGEDRKWLRAPQKKIVSSYFGQSGSFAYDEMGDHIIVQGYGWVPYWKLSKKVGLSSSDLCKAYLAIFNSHFFTELLSETCPAVGGGQLNLSKRYSENIRLPDLIARVEDSAELDLVVRDLSFIGEKIMKEGLALSPRARAEELVRLLYGV